MTVSIAGIALGLVAHLSQSIQGAPKTRPGLITDFSE
jgi:hypothetical protein